MNKTKKAILDKIRFAYATNPIKPEPVHANKKTGFFSAKKENEDLRLMFADQFTSIGGQFLYCQNAQVLIDQLQIITNQMGENVSIFCQHDELKMIISNEMGHLIDQPVDADVSITGCDYLIARTGSVVLNHNKDQFNTIASPIHIVIANDKQLVFDMQDIFKNTKTLPPMLSIVSGPSRTADIEKTLVVGVHGTKSLYVCLVQSPQ